MEFFSDLIQYGYLSNALAACVLSGITCGVVGTYVVCRRMVFLAGGITHASFGGLGIAFYAGANPMAALVAVTIVLSIRIMGIVLLISLLTMPVAIVNALSKSYRTIALCAPLVAVAGNVAGLVASYNFEVPPGAAIIFTLTLTLIIVKLLPLRQKKAGAAA